MSIWKRTLDYLGLGPDDAYDDYDEFEEDEPPPRARRSSEYEPRVSRVDQTGGDDSRGTVRPTFPSRDFDPSAARRQMADDSGIHPRPTRAVGVRAVAAAGEPHTVKPQRFDQAQELADKFKEGLPVIMNLETTNREVSRRLIDFASGLCYALDGTMEKVATGVYLLKPFTRPGSSHDYEGR